MPDNLSDRSPSEDKCCRKPCKWRLAAWALPIVLPVATVSVMSRIFPCMFGGCYATIAVAVFISAYVGIVIAKIVSGYRE
jgi:hypothetical protein